MDKKFTGIKEIPDEEVTRESLIALAYTEPPNDPSLIRDSLIALSYIKPPEDRATKPFADNPKGRYVDTLNRDGAERYRSELISISYLPSPEAKAAQLVPGGFKG